MLRLLPFLQVYCSLGRSGSFIAAPAKFDSSLQFALHNLSSLYSLRHFFLAYFEIEVQDFDTWVKTYKHLNFISTVVLYRSKFVVNLCIYFKKIITPSRCAQSNRHLVVPSRRLCLFYNFFQNYMPPNQIYRSGLQLYKPRCKSSKVISV